MLSDADRHLCKDLALIHAGALLHPFPLGKGHWLWFLCSVGERTLKNSPFI